MEGYLKSDESSFKEVEFFLGGGEGLRKIYNIYIYNVTMYCITIYTNSSTFVKCQESLFLGSFHEPSQNTGTFSIGIQGNYKFPFYTEQI